MLCCGSVAALAGVINSKPHNSSGKVVPSHAGFLDLWFECVFRFFFVGFCFVEPDLAEFCRSELGKAELCITELFIPELFIPELSICILCIRSFRYCCGAMAATTPAVNPVNSMLFAGGQSSFWLALRQLRCRHVVVQLLMHNYVLTQQVIAVSSDGSQLFNSLHQ